jgi:hypothetical protein
LSIIGLVFSERIEFIGQVTECHADNRDDHIGDGRPPLEDLHKEFQAKIINENIAQCDHEITDDLGPSAQGGAAETDVARQPEAREEGDGELKDESGNVGREGNKTQIKHLAFEHIVIEHIVKHPFKG